MKRIGYVLSAVALCSLALGPGFAYAADGAQAPSGKEETVYIYANADGSVKDEKVTATLKNAEGASSLSDTSILRDIKAEDDGQSFTEQGSELTWSAKGDEVTYTGKTDKAAPVSVSVTYKLDGVETPAADMAGKTGRVTIRYTYRNDASLAANSTMFTPFTAITALMFDGDSFKNVTAENGKIVNDGDDVIVVGYAAPGLKESLGSAAEDADVPDFFEVEADVESFEMKSSLTMVSAGLLEDLDLSNVNTAELGDTSGALAEATSALVEGTDELASGLGDLAEGTDGLSDAAWQLNSGAKAASNSLPQLVKAIDKLASGAAELSAGAAELSDGVAATGEGVEQAQQVCQMVEAVLASMGTSIETVKANNSNAEAVLLAASSDENVPEATRAQLAQALAALQANDLYLAALSTDGSTEAAVQQLLVAMDQLSAGLDPEGAAALAEGAEAVKSGAQDLAAGLEALSGSTEPLVSGMNQLVYGTGQLATGASQLADGAKAAAEGSDKLAEGMRTYSDSAISEIIDVIDNKVVNLVDRLDVLKQAARDYDNFSGKTPGTPSSVRFVIEVDAI